jgi:hypothetical protein
VRRLLTIVTIGCVVLACSSDDEHDACTAFGDVATCTYTGYGGQCGVRCSMPASCRFELTVQWTGSCCNERNTHRYCRCVDGFVLCTDPGGEKAPASYCEFCGRDTGTLDTASVDAPTDTAEQPDSGAD